MAKKSGGGITNMMKPVVTSFWLIIVAAGLVALARANDLNSPNDVWDYATSWSQKVDECIGTAEELECDPSLDGNGGETVGDLPKPDEEITEPEIKALLGKLDGLKSSPSEEVAYDRAEWKHWTDPEDNGCDSREDVLMRQGKNVKTSESDQCDVVSGEWVSPYEGLKITDPSSIDIDHVIPLGWAAKNGGQDWDAETKEAFANDFIHLLATSASTNRSKSDRGPSEYMPERKEFWCSYGRIWVSTASKYGLSMPDADKAVLREAIQSC